MSYADKIMSIYYGNDKLPYKDSNRQTHYPIGNGNIYTGENNTTKIRFYVDLIGGSNFTWLATIKLPNGSLVYKLTSGVQSGGYVELDISSLYTEIVGAIFVGLTGYAVGSVNIQYDSEEQTYTVSGDPDRLTTGVVKVIVNYSPQVLNIGSSVQPSEYQMLMGAISTKLDKKQGIPFYQNKASIQSDEVAKSELKQNQVLFDLQTKKFFKYDKANDTFIDLEIGGGGGGGSTYTSGNGIVVDNTNHTIAIDDQVVATKTDLTSKQDKSNLVSSWQETTDDTHYPSEKLVKDSIATETQNRQTADTLITGSVNQINAKIPSQASALNQLADKAFVNSSIATNTANFLGTLDVVSDLGLQYGATHSAVVNALNQHTFSQEKTNNDYCFVINKDNNNNVIYERYKYATNTFAYEYTLNNSSFTASQWNSINSGITSGKVATYDAYETSKQDTIDSQHKLSADLVDDTNSSNKFSQFYIHNAGTGITWQRISEIINSGKLLYLNYAGVLYQYFNGSNIDCYFGSLDMANGGYKLRLITYHPYQRIWEYDEKNIYPTIRNEAPSTSSGNLKEFWFDTTDNSLYLCTSTTGGVRTWTKVSGSSGGGTWGSITGTLSDQTDLKNALDLKQDCIFIDFGD